MDKKTKIFFWVMSLLILASIGATYWRIMVKKDYLIEAQTDCDPYAEKCFIWECDPESTEEGEACTGDPEADVWYFQVIRRNAMNVPLCDPATDEECEALVCGENEPECEYEFCTQENMEAQYASACNDPEQYAIDNPMEGEVCELENEEDCDVVEEEVEDAEEDGAGGEPGTEEGAAGEEGDVADKEDVCDPAVEECVDIKIEETNTLPCDENSGACPVTQETKVNAFPG